MSFVTLRVYHCIVLYDVINDVIDKQRTCCTSKRHRSLTKIQQKHQKNLYKGDRIKYSYNYSPSLNTDSFYIHEMRPRNAL